MIPKHDNTVMPTTGRGHYKVVDDGTYQEKTVLPHQAKRTWHYAIGEEVWIYTTVEGLGVDFHKFTYVGLIGANLYFKRITPTHDEITESFRLIDFEFELVKIYNSEEYKEVKRQIILKELIQWEKSKLV